jgi:hypothetical protein
LELRHRFHNLAYGTHGRAALNPAPHVRIGVCLASLRFANHDVGAHFDVFRKLHVLERGPVAVPHHYEHKRLNSVEASKSYSGGYNEAACGPNDLAGDPD